MKTAGGNEVTDEDTNEAESYDADPAPQGSSLLSRGCAYIGCLVLIGLVVLAGAGVYFGGQALEPLADRYLWTPSDLVRVYLAAYDEGNLERARKFTCSGTVLDPGEPFGTTSSSAFVDDTFPYPRPNGQIAIYYAVRVPGFSIPKRAQALVQREDEGWRICSLRQ